MFRSSDQTDSNGNTVGRSPFLMKSGNLVDPLWCWDTKLSDFPVALVCEGASSCMNVLRSNTRPHSNNHFHSLHNDRRSLLKWPGDFSAVDIRVDLSSDFGKNQWRFCTITGNNTATVLCSPRSDPFLKWTKRRKFRNITSHILFQAESRFLSFQLIFNETPVFWWLLQVLHPAGLGRTSIVCSSRVLAMIAVHVCLLPSVLSIRQFWAD